MNFDVVIVGAGAAGLRAALAAAPHARTAVLSKVHPVRSATGEESGGIAAALGHTAADSWQQHAAEIVESGAGLVDPAVAETLCREIIDDVLELDRLGLPFSRTEDGRIDQRERRTCYAGELTGHHLLYTLYQNCLGAGVRFFDEHLVYALAPSGRGLLALDVASGDTRQFSTGAVVLATGGLGRVYRHTSSPFTVTADGHALAARAGAALRHVDIVQFDAGAAHFAVGGVATDASGAVLGETGAALPGLFAAGELACPGAHGPQPLPGNPLAEAIVFGRRAGTSAALASQASPGADAGFDCDLVDRLRASSGAERSAPIRAALQATMDGHLGPERSPVGLRKAGAEIIGLAERYSRLGLGDPNRRFNTDLVDAIELGALLDVAAAMVSAAQAAA